MTVPSYFPELEAEWLAKGGNKPESELEPWIDISKVRGKDLRSILLNLHYVCVATGIEDNRFLDAAKALSDYGFVDKNGHWKKKIRTILDAEMDFEIYEWVEDHRRQDGLSIKHAAAVVAAKTGKKAASFDRAVDVIRDIHREVVAFVQHEKNSDR